MTEVKHITILVYKRGKKEPEVWWSGIFRSKGWKVTVGEIAKYRLPTLTQSKILGIQKITIHIEKAEE